MVKYMRKEDILIFFQQFLSNALGDKHELFIGSEFELVTNPLSAENAHELELAFKKVLPEEAIVVVISTLEEEPRYCVLVPNSLEIAITIRDITLELLNKHHIVPKELECDGDAPLWKVWEDDPNIIGYSLDDTEKKEGREVLCEAYLRKLTAAYPGMQIKQLSHLAGKEFYMDGVSSNTFISLLNKGRAVPSLFDTCLNFFHKNQEQCTDEALKRVPEELAEVMKLKPDMTG
jgi:hypothetical protein